MEPITISVNNEILAAYPQEDGSFKILLPEKKFIAIYPDTSIDTQVIWDTADLIPKEYAQAIGEAIERAEL